MAKNSIPEGKSKWGRFYELRDKVDQALHGEWVGLIEQQAGRATRDFLVRRGAPSFCSILGGNRVGQILWGSFPIKSGVGKFFARLGKLYVRMRWRFIW